MSKESQHSMLKRCSCLFKRAHQWIISWVWPFPKPLGLILKLLPNVALYFRIRLSREEPLHCPCGECFTSNQSCKLETSINQKLHNGLIAVNEMELNEFSN